MLYMFEHMYMYSCVYPCDIFPLCMSVCVGVCKCESLWELLSCAAASAVAISLRTDVIVSLKSGPEHSCVHVCVCVLVCVYNTCMFCGYIKVCVCRIKKVTWKVTHCTKGTVQCELYFSVNLS